MAELFIRLTRDDVRGQIPFGLICETRESAIWSTGRRRRCWNIWFSEKEKAACTRLFRQARSWYLTTGVPDEVMMSVKTYGLWQKLGAFCASI